jgi:molybdate transport system substrate-binding protein
MIRKIPQKAGRAMLLMGMLFAGCVWGAESKEPLIIFAASSLTDALQKVTDDYTKGSGVSVKVSFAASSALARQIESGARADVFLSADQEWMDYLEARKLIKKASRSDLLANRLVLIVPSDSKVAVKLAQGASLLQSLGPNGRLATGDPDSVPVGKYAKAALTSLSLWKAFEGRIVRADNVRVALMYVARGEAPLGIVYASDAAAEPKVRVADVFPPSTHPAIRYPVAATSVAQPSAQSYLTFLRSEAARRTFEQAKFTIVTADQKSELLPGK